jgi:hypothetical protein
MACRVRLLALSAVMASICLPVAAQSIPSLVGTWKGTSRPVHLGLPRIDRLARPVSVSA